MDLTKAVLEHERNASIKFNKEKHTYHHTGETPAEQFYGITSLIGEYQEPFDAQEVSKWVARRDGKTQQEVLDEWDKKGQDAIAYGNHVHDTIEDYINRGVKGDDEITDLHDRAIEELGLEPIVGEWVVFDESIDRASAIDGVYKWKDKNELVIVDYKTNTEWETKYWKSYGDFHFPIQHMPDNKYHKYGLQLNFYRKWVADIYKLPVSELMYILHIRDGEYTWIPVLDYETEINQIYDLEYDLIS